MLCWIETIFCMDLSSLLNCSPKWLQKSYILPIRRYNLIIKSCFNCGWKKSGRVTLEIWSSTKIISNDIQSKHSQCGRSSQLQLHLCLDFCLPINTNEVPRGTILEALLFSIVSLWKLLNKDQLLTPLRVQRFWKRSWPMWALGNHQTWSSTRVSTWYCTWDIATMDKCSD